MDNDFDQTWVFKQIGPSIETSADVRVGIRWREIAEEENPYEFQRRQDIVRIMASEMHIAAIDPNSAGTQFYRTSAIAELLKTPEVQEYDRKWGLDFFIPLLAASKGLNVAVTNIENSSYDPARRPMQKVRDQYNAYTETIAKFTGKTPQEISSLYDGGII